MLKQLAIVALLVVTLALADDTTQASPQDAPAQEAPPPELSEEQAKEAVFEVSQELAQEVDDAVKTINDVFGNPDCDQQQDQTKRNYYKRHAVEKRGWGRKLIKSVAKAAVVKAAASYLVGKREVQESLEKRGWGRKLIKSIATQAVVKAVTSYVGKREVQESLEKRGWGRKLIKAVATQAVVNAAATYLVGKREVQESLEKRGWGRKIAKVAVASSLLGKRDGEASDASAPAPAEDTPAPAENAPAPASDASPSTEDDEPVSAEEEVQFEADVGRLKEAVETLNQVLVVAESSLGSSS